MANDPQGRSQAGLACPSAEPVADAGRDASRESLSAPRSSSGTLSRGLVEKREGTDLALAHLFDLVRTEQIPGLWRK